MIYANKKLGFFLSFVGGPNVFKKKDVELRRRKITHCIERKEKERRENKMSEKEKVGSKKEGVYNYTSLYLTF